MSIKRRIRYQEEKLRKLNRKIPLLGFAVLLISVISPFIPGRGSRTTLTELFGYPYAFLIGFIIAASGLSYFFINQKSGIEKRIRALKEELESKPPT